MTLEQLEAALYAFGHNNFQFTMHSPNEIEAMVELSDGQFLGIVGENLTEATQALLGKLEQLDEGVIAFGTQDHH